MLESNRGCPYGCTFCDWGSATLSKVRNFDLDRVYGVGVGPWDRQAVFWLYSEVDPGSPEEAFLRDLPSGELPR